MRTRLGMVGNSNLFEVREIRGSVIVIRDELIPHFLSSVQFQDF